MKTRSNNNWTVAEDAAVFYCYYALSRIVPLFSYGLILNRQITQKRINRPRVMPIYYHYFAHISHFKFFWAMLISNHA